MARLSRKRFIKTAAGLVLPAWACSGQVVIPGAIMRTIAGGGGGCTNLRQSETTVSEFQPTFLRYFATQFRAAATYDICKIDVSIARNLSEDSDFQITIRANNAGSPNSVVLGTSDVVPNATVTDDFTVVAFAFSTPVSVTSGSDYWMVITRTEAADGLQVYWEDDDDATVEGMKEAANATPNTWVTISTGKVGVHWIYSQ